MGDYAYTAWCFALPEFPKYMSVGLTGNYN